MRLRLSVNDLVRCTAAIVLPGYLDAHINLTDRSEKGEVETVAWVQGHHLADTETTSFTWPKIELKIGDRVEVEILTIYGISGESQTDRTCR